MYVPQWPLPRGQSGSFQSRRDGHHDRRRMARLGLPSLPMKTWRPLRRAGLEGPCLAFRCRLRSGAGGHSDPPRMAQWPRHEGGGRVLFCTYHAHMPRPPRSSFQEAQIGAHCASAPCPAKGHGPSRSVGLAQLHGPWFPCSQQLPSLASTHLAAPWHHSFGQTGSALTGREQSMAALVWALVLERHNRWSLSLRPCAL